MRRLLISLLLPGLAHAFEPEGTWHLVHSEAERAAILDAAVQKSADAYPLWIRGVVRNKLADVPTWCATYAFDFQSETLGWTCDKERPLTVARADLGTEFMLAHKGKRYPTTIGWSSPLLRARFADKEGSRSQVFRFDPTTHTMKLEVSIEADRLLVPMRWTLTYKRVAPAPAPEQR